MDSINLKEIIHKELSGWKLPEIMCYISVLFLIVYNALILKDNIIAVISAFCGITYTVIAGKGKISCYIFGLTGSGFYAYLAFSNGLYGNFLLYLCYYIPMQILGIINWSRHLNKKNNEIYKTGINNKHCLIIYSFLLCLSLITILILLKDSNPVFDGISTGLSVIGMYLTVKRCIEQWVVWAGVNFITAIMWIKLIFTGEKVYSTALMWIVYFFLAIYFYKEWKTEIKKNNF